MSSESIYLHIIPRQIAKELGLKFYFTGIPCKYDHFSARYTKDGGCAKCSNVKSTSKEAKMRSKKYYTNNKESTKKRQQTYREENKEKISSYQKEYKENNKNYIKEYNNEHYENHKEYYSQKNKEYYNNNIDHIQSKQQTYREENKEKISSYGKEYYTKNKEKVLERNRSHYQKNKEKYSERNRNHYQENPSSYHIRVAKRRAAKLERTLWLSEEHETELKQIYENARILNDIRGDYHVDHIIPLQGELVSGLHVPWNLQIIKAEENLTKRSKFEPYIEVYE